MRGAIAVVAESVPVAERWKVAAEVAEVK